MNDSIKKNKYFYISTPIYYPNAKLHIGHAYTTVMADCFVRYKQMIGYKTFFVTGVDEHGQKIMQEATKHQQDPQTWVNQQTADIKKLWSKLQVAYDCFVRTTSKEHQKHVQHIFRQLQAQGDIYLANYEGFYCVQCEEFIALHLMNETQTCYRCHNDVKKVAEASYFLKVSRYEQVLKQMLADNSFCQPQSVVKELVQNFCTPHIQDLSITRTNVSWGVRVADNPKHIIYVWFDALINYLSCLNYLDQTNQKWRAFWNKESEIVQLLGKEIARFHMLYWPTLLEALQLRQPDHLLAHGWILMDGVKMSKSKQNVIDPVVLIEEHGADAVRFYLTTQLAFAQDNKYHYDLFVEAYNSFLVNNYANLIARVNKMFVNWITDPVTQSNLQQHDEMHEIMQKTVQTYQVAFDRYDSVTAFQAVNDLLHLTNKFLETNKPWHLTTKPKQLFFILSNALIAIVISSYLLQPFIPTTVAKVFGHYQINQKNITWDNLVELTWLETISVTQMSHLFQRIKNK